MQETFQIKTSGIHRRRLRAQYETKGTEKTPHSCSERDYPRKEILQELRENSALLRTITKSLYIRRLAGESATRQLTNIEKTGFDTSRITGLFKEHIHRIRKISTQLENDSDI